MRDGRRILETSRGTSYCRVTISQRSTPHSSIRMAGKNRYKVIRGKHTSRVSILKLLTPSPIPLTLPSTLSSNFDVPIGQ